MLHKLFWNNSLWLQGWKQGCSPKLHRWLLGRHLQTTIFCARSWWLSCKVEVLAENFLKIFIIRQICLRTPPSWPSDSSLLGFDLSDSILILTAFSTVGTMVADTGSLLLMLFPQSLTHDNPLRTICWMNEMKCYPWAHHGNIAWEIQTVQMTPFKALALSRTNTFDGDLQHHTVAREDL